ncbi:MAG TPA: LamG-like jellyroll fold domain-containing protein [Lacipirellulaceae bacterium]|nr:LamG-like jellyroll fold domain-containing protein [Lacipirellulaceae bacterium]
MNLPQNIAELLDDYVDGAIDAPRHQVLCDWIGESEANCRSVADWFLAEARLHEASRLADMREVFEGSPLSSMRSAAREAVTESKPHKRRSYAAAYAVAAAVTLFVVGSALWIANKTTAHNRQLKNVVSRRPAVKELAPAIVGRLSDCVWVAGAKQFRVGEDIAVGSTIDIASGLAQLVFESGAEVVVKGPSRVEVDSSMLCRLQAGSVSAEVPHRAAGFTIRGPASEVIDLGTRFGYSVGDDGKSEVHVFQGEVISRELDDSGSVVGKEIRLKEKQAVLFPGAKQQARRLAANEAKFALEVKPLWLNDTIEPLTVDRKLALWLRSAHGVLRDKDNRVVAWQDLAVGPNRIADDVFQPNPKYRPQYVEDGLNGHPGIRFDGMQTYMTSIPITTTNEQTIVAVFQYAEPSESPHIGGQIINYNGPPSRFLPNVNGPGVLQLGEKIDTWNGPPLSISAKAFVGRDSQRDDVSAGVVTSGPLGSSRARIVAYVYDNSADKAALYVDGARAAESSAPTRVAITSRKVIGKHGIFDQWYFHGDLAEVLIFNTALRPAELEALTRQLSEYYGLSLATKRSS